MQTDKIYLVGFMGAGKSSVAEALGARLGWSIDDIDQRIENTEGRSIADIFDRDGEAYFREVERAVLHKVLAHRHTVVATGGGTFVDPLNRSRINRDGVSIWLDVSFETVVERIPADGRRPLAADRASMRALWAERRESYSLAHYRLDADTEPVEQLAEHLVDRLSL